MLAAFFAACALVRHCKVLRLDNSLQVVPGNHGLTFPLRIDAAAPDTVALGEAFQLVFTLRNPTLRTVTFTTPHSCVYTFQLNLDGELAYLRDSDAICATVVTTHTIPPGDSIHLVDDVVAAEESSDGPLPPGTYEIRAVMERLAGAKPVVPDVETQVTVVE